MSLTTQDLADNQFLKVKQEHKYTLIFQVFEVLPKGKRPFAWNSYFDLIRLINTHKKSFKIKLIQNEINSALLNFINGKKKDES